MQNLIEFPGLGIHLQLSRVAFTVFGVPIYWYGICIALGMVLAVLFAMKQAPRFGIDADHMLDVVFIGILAGVLGARLYYVLFIGTQLSSPLEFFYTRGGGLGIYGGIIGGFLGALIGCKWRRVPILPMFDLTGMGFLIGQAVGRWGNFFNQEAFGTNTTLPWGMVSDNTRWYLASQQAALAAQGVYVDPNLPVHPTFLYESLWCALGFLLLWRYSYHRRFNGEIALLYVAWYGLGRFFIEGLRTDSLMIGSVRVSQALAATSVLVALAVWACIRVRVRGKPLKVPTPPPHTERVRLTANGAEKTVTVSWPANTKAPTKEQKLQMARDLLAEQAASTPTTGAADSQPATAPASKEKQPDSPPDASAPTPASTPTNPTPEEEPHGGKTD